MSTGQRLYAVTNATRDTELATRAGRADRFVRRGLGLMGRRFLPPGSGLIIEPCNSVVTFFMRFPIDVLFVDDQGTVLHIQHSMRPWRTSKIVRGSRFVVELPAGRSQETGTSVGDVIAIRPA